MRPRKGRADTRARHTYNFWAPYSANLLIAMENVLHRGKDWYRCWSYHLQLSMHALHARELTRSATLCTILMALLDEEGTDEISLMLPFLQTSPAKPCRALQHPASMSSHQPWTIFIRIVAEKNTSEDWRKVIVIVIVGRPVNLHMRTTLRILYM